MRTQFAAIVSLSWVLAACQCSRTTPAPIAAPLATPSASASAAIAEAPGLKIIGEVDEKIRAVWSQAGVDPSITVDDARFLRRVTLDLIGNLPTVEEVTTFLADTSPDRRERAIDRLLTSRGYAEHWTDVWDQLLLGDDIRAKQVDRLAFRKWLYPQFKNNVPWNRVVTELITARGVNSTGDRRPREMLVESAQDVADAPPDPGVNGAVNWFVRHANAPADLSGAASRLFLGVQIQCAQCHDHKTEAWKQEDFRKLTSCFASIQPKPVTDRKDPEIDKFDIEDVDRPRRKGKKMMGDAAEMRAYQESTPTALDGTVFPADTERRKAFAAWLTAPANPYFSRAFVNRAWGTLLGRGFVEPLDDFRPSNPPIAPEVLDALANDFTASGYDVKRLLKVIVSTEAYQRASTPVKNGDARKTAWAKYPLKDLDPEVLLDSLITATRMGPVMAKVPPEKNAEMRYTLQRQFKFVFDVDEESSSDTEGTITQALMLLNGAVTNNGVRGQPGSALAEVMELPGSDEDKIRSLYLRTLSRPPRADELKYWVAFLSEPREAVKPKPAGSAGAPLPPPDNKGGKKGKRKDPMAGADMLSKLGRNVPQARDARHQAFEDMFWALLNSSEFLYNH